jgi:hypothetical protein
LIGSVGGALLSSVAIDYFDEEIEEFLEWEMF